MWSASTPVSITRIGCEPMKALKTRKPWPLDSFHSSDGSGADLRHLRLCSLQINVIATGLLALRELPVLGRTANLPGDKSIKPHLAIVSSDLHIFAKFPQQREPNIIAALNVEEKAVHKETYNTSKRKCALRASPR